ncbi:MAG: enoyl-CoA hydratase-related protein [Spirochaetota bacterium]|nr:enoyl-CoA hydratase-related protein [Spirochaetota bacterium]
MGNDQILREERDFIGIITINNPEKRNAVNNEMLKVINDTLLDMDKNGTRVIIIKGAGDKTFCAGYDVTTFQSEGIQSKDKDFEITDEYVKNFERSNYLQIMVRTIDEISVPVIAMINGHCIGAGIDIACGCDLRYAAAGVKLGLPPLNLGIVYHPDGFRRVINVAGVARAKELLYLGENIKSDEAYELGLVNRVLPKEQLEEYTMNAARTITEKSPLAVRGTKRVLSFVFEHQELSDDRKREAMKLTMKAFQSEDSLEAVSAFLEKRKPNFKGK